MLISLLNSLLSLLYPPRCKGCGIAVARNGAWCEPCRLSFWNPRMLHDSRELRGLDGCYALTNYRGSIRRVIQDLKFNNRRNNDVYFFDLLAQFPWLERFTDIDFMVPIPLSKERIKQRGFNQTEAIFYSWCVHQEFSWQDCLERTRNTEAQWHLHQKERRENIKKAFQLKGSIDLTGKKILLVDDIYTTGSTLKEGAHMLKQNGAQRVIGLVISSGAV